LTLAWTALPTLAADDVLYTSQPDEVAIFYNDIAFARDVIQLPGGTDVQILLPTTIFHDTLLVYQDDERVSTYRVNRGSNGITLNWQTTGGVSLVEVRLEYLMSGMSWRPKYDMWIAGDDEENVRFDFFAEITNRVLDLDAVDVKLIAGHVDTSRPVDAVATATLNQTIVGYEQTEIPVEGPQLDGQASIQHVYDIGTLEAHPGDLVYTSLAQNTLAARRELIWNAAGDNEVTVIYKVRNESDIPFAQGIVRSYENGLFLGSDFIEVTPIGGEGSVTVGSLQDVRVMKERRDTFVDGHAESDELHEFELKITNLSTDTVDMDVVDTYPRGANMFEFEPEAALEGGNRIRWTLTLEPGEEITLQYAFRT
jgi:hypothetical protein